MWQWLVESVTELVLTAWRLYMSRGISEVLDVLQACRRIASAGSGPSQSVGMRSRLHRGQFVGV